MIAKCMIVAFMALFSLYSASAAVVPAAYVAPYATSYNAHYVNHAVAAPLVNAAPIAAAYSTYPYTAAAYPYAAAYSAPIVVAK